jgi:hypothetical protein
MPAIPRRHGCASSFIPARDAALQRNVHFPKEKTSPMSILPNARKVPVGLAYVLVAALS